MWLDSIYVAYLWQIQMRRTLYNFFYTNLYTSAKLPYFYKAMNFLELLLETKNICSSKTVDFPVFKLNIFFYSVQWGHYPFCESWVLFCNTMYVQYNISYNINISCPLSGPWVFISIFVYPRPDRCFTFSRHSRISPPICERHPKSATINHPLYSSTYNARLDET